MCGICGQLNFEPDRPVPAGQLERMNKTLHHRGPDEDGFYLKPPVGLAMRRLSIIDLSTGRQTIQNEDGSVRVVYNGEIYNFLEIREELERAGHRFVTHSDTEVIAHLYEEEGEAFVHRLNGMFAIALWDERQKKLLLVRDRLGIKPLYYYADAGKLVFGSEIKALLEADVPREIDEQALSHYLALGYIPAPWSIFRGIRKVPPGHLLRAEAGAVKVEAWWELPGETTADTRPEPELVEELRALLADAVKIRLISDVPLGVFLSGGVDSSAIVAMMARAASGPVRTFSIGFSEKSFSELAFARRVASRFGTRHEELEIRPDPVEILPKLAAAFDEPFADSSAIPTWYVSNMARRSVTVALGGDGGDELFGGYETYAAYKWASVYRRLPAFLGEGIVPAIVRRLPVSDAKISFDYKAKRFVASAGRPPVDAHLGWKEIFGTAQRDALLADGVPRGSGPLNLFMETCDGFSGGDTLARLMKLDTKLYLPDDILVKVDRMSMANSLEVRPPILDYRIAEWASRLPSRHKVRGLRKKALFRKALRGILPDEILNRRKAGFNVPMAAWLREDLRETLLDALSPARLRSQGIFRPEAVTGLWEDHASRRTDNSRQLWTLLTFSLWYDRYYRR
ncbi:MAG: asparagine synthase (glutamine-hydrolyzing) [Myxococcota bacterium]